MTFCLPGGIGPKVPSGARVARRPAIHKKPGVVHRVGPVVVPPWPQADGHATFISRHAQIGCPHGVAAVGEHPGVDRQILALAVPAFLALVAEPLFLLADSAIVGHLGTAGARRPRHRLGRAPPRRRAVRLPRLRRPPRRWPGEVGAGQARRALQQGVDGLWLALLDRGRAHRRRCSHHRPLVALFGTDPEVTAAATTYLRISWLGLTPMLLVLAATGVLRGLADTRTPLVVAVAANLLNIVLNVVLVYGFDLGIGGSAVGTVLAQMRAPRPTSPWPCVRAARGRGRDLAPRPPRRTSCRTRRLRRSWSGRSTCRLPAHDDLGRGVARAPSPPPPTSSRCHAVDLPGLRPRRARDRRPDDHRHRAGGRRPGAHPLADPAG